MLAAAIIKVNTYVMIHCLLNSRKNLKMLKFALLSQGWWERRGCLTPMKGKPSLGKSPRVNLTIIVALLS